jgi:aspartate kinase
MLVMKFGGTSVGSPERFLTIVDIVRKTSKEHGAPVVVVSAMSGVTDLLIKAAQEAKDRNLDAALDVLDKIHEKHKDTIYTLFQQASIVDELVEDLENHLNKLDIILRGVSYLGELTKRSLDAISCFGELLSSLILATLLEKEGIESKWIDARSFLITDNTFGKAVPLWETTTAKAQGTILPELADDRVVVTQGFIGSTSNGITTTLGRGGSDYSAAIIGVACEADEIQIWTDVDGMMTADPRVVPDAKVLSTVSFQAASELAYFGAKVLHPLTIKPAVEKNIPVRILNTLKTEARGTVISDDDDDDQPIYAIASKKSITALFFNSLNMLMSHGFLAKLFSVFDKYRTPIDLIATSEVSVSVTIDNTENIESIMENLYDLCDVRMMQDVAIVSVVGTHFRAKSGIAGKVFDCLKDINIIMISGGASDITLSFVVSNEDADRAVKKLHDHLFQKVK